MASIQLIALTNTYHDYPLEDALRGIAAAGFGGIEIAAVRGWSEHVSLDASASDVERVKKIIREHGLEVVSMSGHSDLATDGGVEQFHNAMDLCAAFDATLINTGAGGELHPGEERMRGLRAAFLERIGSVADRACAQGLTVCIEVHGDLVPTGQIGAQMIEEIDLDNVRLNYDTGNARFYGGVDPVEDIVHALPYTASVHIKDHVGPRGNWNFPAIGTGEIDFDGIFGKLEAAGYEGPCSVELEFEGEPWPPLGDIDRAMSTSHEFLRRYSPSCHD